MDIFNRPPTISEDTLQYTLHPPDNLLDKASVTSLATVMQSFVQSLLPDHLWHKDAFQLKVVASTAEGWMLEGRMRVGDCIDDEWCAVWLLREISSKWDVMISVSDTDGEFLLIEAAEYLPHWVTPSNAENRVWIYSSHLHLIPLSHVSVPSSKPRHCRHLGANDSDDEDGLNDHEEEDYITVEDALKVVRDPLIDTRAPQEVEDIVWRKIRGYPAAARQHVHYTKAYLPVDIAKALSVNPSLVQKPIETFYTRDALQLRAAHKMARFPPEPSILTTVKMTRAAYAQLLGQKFYPPKIFGRWQEKEGSPEWKWRDIGMKLACGFEMLYQENKNRPAKSESSPEGVQSSLAPDKEALRRNLDYTKYMQSLVSSGYFKGELEGSTLWSELEDKAAAAFVEARRDDDSTRPTFASDVNVAIVHASDDSFVSKREEDLDDWLNIDSTDFDSMLEKTMGRGARQGTAASSNEMMNVDQNDDPKAEEDRIAAEQAARLQKLAKKVEDFIEGEGDLEGARFEDDVSSDEAFSDADSGDSDDGEDVGMANESHEMNDQQRAARQADMDRLVAALEPSEYGKLPPSFHNNSQRVARTTMETDVVENAVKPAPTSFTEEACKRTIRAPIIPRDKYDGVDSDDETDEEDGDNEDEESEEDKPQVVGDIEIDMEEEEEEFLEFARQALGVSDQQWHEIVQDRKDRGAFVPATITSKSKLRKPRATSDASPSHNESPQPRKPVPGPRPNVNPNLDSFEAVMQAMEAELSRSRSENRTGEPYKADKGKVKENRADKSGDIEAAMDAELKAILDRDYEEEEEQAQEQPDYNLIKNFLESFKSQAGLSGPVGNLVGRLDPGWMLPRDG